MCKGSNQAWSTLCDCALLSWTRKFSTKIHESVQLSALLHFCSLVFTLVVAVFIVCRGLTKPSVARNITTLMYRSRPSHMRAECMLVLHELPPLRIPKVLCIPTSWPFLDNLELSDPSCLNPTLLHTYTRNTTLTQITQHKQSFSKTTRKTR